MSLKSMITALFAPLRALGVYRRRVQSTSSIRSDAAVCVFEPRTMLAAGSLDTTFANGSGRTITAFDLGGLNADKAHAVALQKDGKIVVAGTADSSAGGLWAVARYTVDGNLDSTFANGAGKKLLSLNSYHSTVNDAVGIAIQDDGKILIVGSWKYDSNDGMHLSVVRLSSNGNLDTTFNSTGVKRIQLLGHNSAAGICIQRNGKIVIAGNTYYDSAGNSHITVARLNSNGTFDRTFDRDGIRLASFSGDGESSYRPGTSFCEALTIQPDGKILVAGKVQLKGDDSWDFGVARLKANGSYDTTFSSDGRTSIGFNLGTTPSSRRDFANAISVQGGKVVVAGTAYKDDDLDSDFAVARLNADGSLDNSFSSDGKKTIAFDLSGFKHDEAYAVASLADGSIVLAGRAGTAVGKYDYAIARVRPDGTLDTSFNGTGKVYSRLSGDDYFAAIAVQSNGKIIGVGTSSIFGDYDFGIVRLLSQ